MAINHGHNEVEPSNPSVSYDTSDLGARGILIFFVVLAVFAVAVHVGILGLYAGLLKATAAHDVEASPLASRTIAPQPGVLANTASINIQKFPEPRLQSNDTGDMERFLQKESAALTAEPWHDAQGNAHLPIAVAMEQTVAKLPVRTGSSAPAQYPGAHREYSYPTATDAVAGSGEATSAGQPESK